MDKLVNMAEVECLNDVILADGIESLRILYKNGSLKTIIANYNKRKALVIEKDNQFQENVLLIGDLTAEIENTKTNEEQFI